MVPPVASLVIAISGLACADRTAAGEGRDPGRIVVTAQYEGAAPAEVEASIAQP